jgi:hypothetical protein
MRWTRILRLLSLTLSASIVLIGSIRGGAEGRIQDGNRLPANSIRGDGIAAYKTTESPSTSDLRRLSATGLRRLSTTGIRRLSATGIWRLSATGRLLTASSTPLIRLFSATISTPTKRFLFDAQSELYVFFLSTRTAGISVLLQPQR